LVAPGWQGVQKSRPAASIRCRNQTLAPDLKILFGSDSFTENKRKQIAEAARACAAHRAR
jgi:hypothetical protein